MSVACGDLIWIPVEPELLRAAAARTARGLLFAPNRRPRPTPWQLRQRSSFTTAELLVRRWLDHERAPYQLASLAPVTEPDKRSMVLGGRQAVIVARFLSSPIEVDRADKLLDARVPSAFRRRAEISLRKGDLLIFAFLVPGAGPCENSTGAYLAAWPPASRASRLMPRRFFHIHSRARDAVQLELAGIVTWRRLATGQMSLAPLVQVPIDPAFQLLLYLHPAERPTGDLELISEGSRGIWAVGPHDWANLTPPLSAAVLAGWITVGGSHSGPGAYGDPLASVNRLGDPPLEVRCLRPMQELTERLRRTNELSQHPVPVS